ncbi:MAG: hypothetical protein UH241_05845 [Acutalibacteraceae bacterium]|nr:hypothetical protein [Acutalibacteraceae bacterium]
MAEFCIDCWNKINGTTYKENEYVISKELELCEGCGQYKNVIVMKKENTIKGLLKILLFYDM